MWDEIFAEIGGDVKCSTSKKDERGITRTVSPANPVTGDLLDDAGWLEAAKGGGALSEKGKDDKGVSKSRTAKEASGKQALKALNKLFGLSKAKAKKDAAKEGTESEEDTALEGAAK